MIDIFVSYTEKDRELARRIATLLEAHGWSVWWDRRIPAGETWRSVLESALEGMRCMVVLWSSRSIVSEWVHEEASEGRRQGKLFPVLLEAVRPPAGFRELQAADLSGWDGTAEFEAMRLLLTDLERFLGKPVNSTPGSPAAGQTGPESVATDPTRHAAAQGAGLAALPGSRTIQVGALAGALLLVAGGAYLALRPSSLAVPTASRPALPAPTPSPPSREAPAPTEIPPRQASAAADPLAVPPAVPRTAPATRPAARTKPAVNARCSDWLARIQLGETLSEEAQSAYRKECR